MNRRLLFRSVGALDRAIWAVAAMGCGFSLQAANVSSTWSGADGSWESAANWTNLPATAQAPNNGNGGFTYDALLGNGSAITLGSDVTIQKFTLAAGTLTGAGNLTALDTFTWNSGTSSGSGVLNASGGAALNFGSNGATLSQRTLNLGAGKTSTWTGAGDLYFGAGATLSNAGTFNIQNDRAMQFNNIGTLGLLSNSGTLTKTVATGATNINVTFTNTGSVAVQSGTLNFNRGGSSSGSIAGAGTVGFGGDSMNLTGGFAMTGATAVTAGTVTFNTASAASTGSLLLSGGAITGASTLNVTGAMTWLGGAMSGAGITNVGGGLTINVTGSTFGLNQRTLNLAAGQTSTWSGAGDMFLSGATINNDGTFDFQADRSMVQNGQAQSTFNNTGLLTKTAGTGTATVGIAFTNSGVVDVQSGTLTFNGGGTSTGTMQGAGAVAFGGDGKVMTITGSYQVAGETKIGGGSVVNFNTAAPMTTGKLTVNGGVVGGTAVINASDVVTWTGGSMTGASVINANGGMVINLASNTGTLSQRTLNLAANHTTTWLGTGDISLETGATIKNSGLFDIQNDRSIFVQTFSEPSFLNSGVLAKSAGTGSTSIFVTILSTGEIHPEAGRLIFAGGGSSSGAIVGAGSIGFSAGTMDISGSYTVGGDTLISGGTVNLHPASSASSGSLTLTGGTLTGSADLLVSGLFDWQGGTLSGASVLNANGGMTLNFQGIGGGLSGRTLNLGAGKTSTWKGIGDLFLDSGAVINNHGTFDLQNDRTIEQIGEVASAFNNTGTLIKSAGTGSSTIGVAFSNSGTVSVQSGTLVVKAALAQVSGTTLTGGTWIVGNLATLSLPTVGNIVTNKGDVRLAGANSVFTNISTLANNQGAFRLSAGRSFTTVGSLTNSGTVSVDGAGTHLAVSGAYTQTAGSTDLGSGGGLLSATSLSIQAGSLVGSGSIAGATTVAGTFSPGHSAGGISIAGNFTLTSTAQSFFEIGGLAAGSGYDVLTQTSGTSLTLGGTLTLTLIGGFENQITADDSFEIVLGNGGTLHGQFANAANGMRLTTADGKASFVVNYTASGVTLTDFSAVPEPAPVALLISGAALAFFAVRRRRSKAEVSA
ncbi:MAG TPA: PEP-CTERM sorting domain-containing protein [Chthoniobacterales bacterium]